MAPSEEGTGELRGAILPTRGCATLLTTRRECPLRPFRMVLDRTQAVAADINSRHRYLSPRYSLSQTSWLNSATSSP